MGIYQICFLVIHEISTVLIHFIIILLILTTGDVVHPLLVVEIPTHGLFNALLELQRELGWEPSLQFEEGIEKTVRRYLDNQEWMDNITSGEYEKYYDDMYKNR